MKLLLLLAVLLFAVWLWRSARAGEDKADAKPQPPTTPPPPEITSMVQCRHCQVHLPFEEAVLGVWGPYCSSAHLSAAGDKAPHS
jgi:uncharacterized protein